MFKRIIVACVGLGLALPAMAETSDSALDTAIGELESTASAVATGAGTLVVAALAIFAVIFGVRKVKRALSAGS